MDLERILAPLQTPRERLYVHARLRGMSERAAYLAAGGKGVPSDKSWCNATHVQEVLRNAQNVSAEETGITRDRIKDMFLEAYNNATTAAEQVMAARELARLFGHYAPTKVKVDHDHKHSIEDKRKNLAELPLAQLEDMLVIDAEFHEVAPRALLRHDA